MPKSKTIQEKFADSVTALSELECNVEHRSFKKIEFFPGAVEFTIRGYRNKNIVMYTILFSVFAILGLSSGLFLWDRALIGLKIILVLSTTFSLISLFVCLQRVFGLKVIRISQRGISVFSMPNKRRCEIKRPFNYFRKLGVEPCHGDSHYNNERYQLIARGTLGDDLILIRNIKGRQQARYIQAAIDKIIGGH